MSIRAPRAGTARTRPAAAAEEALAASASRPRPAARRPRPTADAGPRWAVRAGRPLAAVVAVVLGLAATLVYAWMSVGQWQRMESPSWDLAIFTQMARAYAEGHAPIVDIKGHGFNLWGDHFHPILVLLAPVYALWPSGLSLLIAQDVLLGLGAGILAWFGTRYLGILRGLALGVAFALSFGVLEAVRVQFHEVAFAVPLLALGLCFLALGRYRPAVLWAAPLVFVKEDLGATVAVIGLVLAWRAAREAAPRDLPPGSWPWRRLRRTRASDAGQALCAWGLGWSLLAVTVILPALNVHGTFDYADKVDLGAALGDPLGAFGELFQPAVKTRTLGLLVLTGAVVFLRSPLAWVGLPTILWRFLSTNTGYWEPTWHYNLVLMPVVLAAVFDVALRARNAPAPLADPATGRGRAARAMRSVLGAAPVLAGVVGLALLPSSPLAGAARAASAGEPASVQVRRDALETIPAGTSVAADLSVLTWLVPDHRVHWIGTPGDPAPDYVALQTDGATWGGRGPQDPAGYARDHYGASYRYVFARDGMVVLQRQD